MPRVTKIAGAPSFDKIHKEIDMPDKRNISRTIAVAATLLAFGVTDYLSKSAAQSPPFAYHTNLAPGAGLPEDDWTGGPRECDLANGISTSCLFMD